jgi:hypothetical protein
MSYTLESLAGDCREALRGNSEQIGRTAVRDLIAKACADDDFVNTHLGADDAPERHILYEDPNLGFCILAHVYRGEKHSNPHDHGPSWAIYGQAAGTTSMTDWKVIKRPENGEPGLVESAREYDMKRGDAYLYNVGDVHSPSRTGETRLVRVEGMDMTKVKRDKYEIA